MTKCIQKGVRGEIVRTFMDNKTLLVITVCTLCVISFVTTSQNMVESRRVFMSWHQYTAMSAGVYPIGSVLFFYIFFVVLSVVLIYGLWEFHQKRLQDLPTPLVAELLGVPESLNLFDNSEAILRVENRGKEPAKKIRVLGADTWIISLEPGEHVDIVLPLDTLCAGIHKVSARVYYKQWKVTASCIYHVFLRKSSQNKYLTILGLKPGATLEEIKKARNKMAKKYHPDIKEGYEEKMKQINEAYHILVDNAN